MKLLLTGVLEDGSPRRGDVPSNPRANVTFPRGSNLTVVVRVVTPTGAPVLLVTGDALLLTVKRSTTQHPPWISKLATIAGGLGTFEITPQDTNLMQPGLYGYDVWLTRSGRRDAVIPLSPLQLLASAAPVPPP